MSNAARRTLNRNRKHRSAARNIVRLLQIPPMIPEQEKVNDESIARGLLSIEDYDRLPLAARGR